VLSFNPQILLELHTLAPGIPTTLALWTEWQSRRADTIRFALTSAATTITLADFLVLEDPDCVKDCHQAGLQIHVYPVSPTRGESEFESWTAESQNVKWLKLAQLGVDGLVTDFPRQTVAFFREQGMML
jgi:glycerophosphoryl diester phosphodiesterase